MQKNTLPYIKNAYLWYAKNVSEKFAVTYSFSSSERLFNGEKLWAIYLPHT